MSDTEAARRVPTDLELLDPLRRVLATMLQQADHEITAETLKARTGLDEGGLFRALTQLESAGWVARGAAPPGGEPTRWRVTTTGQAEVARLKLLAEPELVTAHGGGLVMRASGHQFRAWYVGSLLAGTSLVLGAGLRGLLEMPWWLVGLVLAGGLALSVAGYGVRLRMAVTELTPTGVVVRTWYGRTRTIRRESIAKVVLAAVSTGRSELDYMLFISRRGQCLARASTQAIDRSSQRAFAEQLRVPVLEGHWGGPRQLRAHFPGSASWATSHPRVLGWVLGLLIILGVVAGVVILTLLGALH
jgi:DNA-binding MarR family transcriptional regulator